MANPTTNYGFVLPTPTDLVTDLPADFDIALQGVDTRLKALQPGTTSGDLAYSSATANTNVRLGIGQAGQVLAVVAGVPAWTTGTTGDIEGVTAGIGISGGGTSGTVTVTNSMATAIDAKGDLVVGTAGDTFSRLAVGATNGMVLTVDSAEATGLKYATPAASTPSFVGCFLTKSANQQANDNTVTICTFDTEELDTDAFHSTSTNTSRITIPAGKAGKYLAIFQLAYSGNATGARQVIFNKNGTAIGSSSNNVANTNQATVSGQYILDLAVADFIEISGFQNSGTNINMLSTGNAPAFCRFAVTYLGA